MIDKVREYNKQKKLFEEGDGIVVGVSGGADSVCLLFVLSELAREWKLTLRVIHVHHGLRLSADRDEAYVAELCERLSIPMKAIHVDVKKYGAENHMGTEEAGRALRYGAFEEERIQLERELPGHKAYIAVAHHMNDNAETLLLHLFRGSGLRGLRGIAPKSGHIIRPLLSVSRTEIEEYLEQNGIAFCTDETNFTDEYVRNRIRNHLLPYAEQEIYHGAMKNAALAAGRLWQVDEYLSKVAREHINKYVDFREGSAFISDAYITEDTVFDSYVLTDIIETLSGCRKDITSVHVESFREMLSAPCGTRLSLPYGIAACKDHDGIVFSSIELGEGVSEFTYEFPFPLTEDKEYRVSTAGLGELVFCLHSEAESVRKKAEIPSKTYTKYFDYDRINAALCMRHRLSGDRIGVLAGGGSKKLKDYFINEHIPARKRDALYVIASGSDILWVIGYRIGSSYKLTADTKRVLEISIETDDRKGFCHEGTSESTF